jgi:hypothetical protein
VGASISSRRVQAAPETAHHVTQPPLDSPQDENDANSGRQTPDSSLSRLDNAQLSRDEHRHLPEQSPYM